MPLIVQDNNGLANANTYVSVSELQDYTNQRGIVLNSSDLEPLLFQAMEYIDSKQYKGEPLNDVQTTAFPRKGVGVPIAVKRAQLSLATIADTTPLMPNILPNERVVKQEVVDSISVTYDTGQKTDDGLPYFSYADSLLKPYLDDGKTSGLGMNVRVFRG